jgi:hypothetical protein
LDVGKVVNGLGQWQVLTKLESMTVAAGSRAAPAILGCRAVYQREGGSLETAVQLLDRAIGSAQVSPGATRWLSLERAQILVRLDRNDEARTALDDLARSGFPAERLGYWFAVLDERAGRFPAVLEWTSGDHADPAVSRGAHSMAAFVLLANGRFPGAQREFWITTTVAEAATSPVMEALLREYVSWSVSWTEPERGAALAAAALEANERMGSTIGIARSLAAMALAEVGSVPLPGVLRRTAESIELMRRAGYRSDCVHPFMVEALAFAVAGELTGLVEARRQLCDLTSSLRTHGHLEQISLWWLEEVSRAAGSDVTVGEVPCAWQHEPVQWLDGAAEARHQWVEVLTTRPRTAAR